MSLETRITALATAIAAEFNGRGEIFVGFPAWCYAETPPPGWVILDGSTLAVLSYQALADHLYCGDSKNATASWGYRATSALSPATNRSTTGAYIVLPDARNRYVRGWQGGGAFDLRTYYADSLATHTHSVSSATASNTQVGGSNGRVTSVGASSGGASVSGGETRPRTIMALPIIYAGP